MPKQANYRGPNKDSKHGKSLALVFENYRHDAETAKNISGIIVPEGARSVSCEIVPLRHDLGLGRSMIKSQRSQAVTIIKLTKNNDERGHLLSVHVHYVKMHFADRRTPNKVKYWRDALQAAYMDAYLKFAPQVLKEAGVKKGEPVVSDFFADRDGVDISPFLEWVRGAPNLTEVHDVVHSGLGGRLEDHHALANEMKEEAAGPGMWRHLRDEEHKKNANGKPPRQSGLINFDQLNQVNLNLNQDGRTFLAFLVRTSSGDNGSVMLGFTVYDRARAVLGRLVHTGRVMVGNGNFLQTPCRKSIYVLATALAAWHDRRLLDKGLIVQKVGDRNKVPKWDDIRDEEDLCLRVPDSDLRRHRQIFHLKKRQVVLWTDENIEAVAREAAALRAQAEGESSEIASESPAQQLKRRWDFSEADKKYWLAWVANKLKDEGSIASASVVDANELHATKLADVEDDVNELSTHSPASTADQSTEDVSNADAMLARILSTLEELDEEGKSSDEPAAFRDQASELMQLHDEIAELKAKLDGNTLSPEDATLLKRKLNQVEMVCSMLVMEETEAAASDRGP